MYSDSTHGDLIPRQDWQLSLVKFFNSQQEPELQGKVQGLTRICHAHLHFLGIICSKFYLDDLTTLDDIWDTNV